MVRLRCDLTYLVAKMRGASSVRSQEEEDTSFSYVIGAKMRGARAFYHVADLVPEHP